MDMETHLLKLEARYRRASSAATAAKAHYAALAAEPGVRFEEVQAARAHWLKLTAHKQELAARMGEIESLEDLRI
jgi:hypothetical protein